MSKKVSRNAELLLYTLMRVGRRRGHCRKHGEATTNTKAPTRTSVRRLGDTLPTACRRALTSVAQQTVTELPCTLTFVIRLRSPLGLPYGQLGSHLMDQTARVDNEASYRRAAARGAGARRCWPVGGCTTRPITVGCACGQHVPRPSHTRRERGGGGGGDGGGGGGSGARRFR